MARGKMGPRISPSVEVIVGNGKGKGQGSAAKGNTKPGNGKGKAKGKGKGTEVFKTYIRGVTQGVGSYPAKPYGKGKGKSIAAYLDAENPCHLSLPRAIAAYSVIRTTTLIAAPSAGDTPSATSVYIFGPSLVRSPAGLAHDEGWTSQAMLAGVDADLAINATNNCRRYNFSMPSATWGAANICPAAFTVQIMSANTLQDAGGINRIGRVKQALNISGDTRTWAQLANDWAQYSAPRLCSAGKLALRGVKASAVPVNLSELSDFAELSIGPSGVITLSAAEPSFNGFAPIIVASSNSLISTGPDSYRRQNLQFLVTCEWRVRFDPLNPAYSGHTYHPPASQSTWNQVMQHAEAAGHGVADIVETVSAFGAAASTIGSFMV